MGQILIRNLEDTVIESYKVKARAAGTSLEQYLRDLLTRQSPMSATERLAFTRSIRDKVARPSAPLSKDEIREGLE
jgi:antitoxin FitA